MSLLGVGANIVELGLKKVADEKAAKIAALRAEANAARFGGDVDVSYRGDHVAPSAEYGAPLHNITEMIPEDVYGPAGRRLYGLGNDAVDEEAFGVLNAVRGNPDAEVQMYRAVPSDAPDQIADGDWVTTSREYADMHGQNTLNGDYKVLEEPTFARRLQSEGYPYEFGYMENGFADPRLLAGTAAGASGLLALGASDDSEAGPLAKSISKALNRQDDVNLPWSSEATYTHDPSGGFMRLGIYPDGTASTLGLEVPEEFRRGGIGSELQESALLDYPEMQGQVSSKSALKNAYRLGRRPVEEPEATLERALEMQREASSVNMRRPPEQGNADPRLLAGTAAGTTGLLAAPALMKDEPVDPTAPLPAPSFGEQMGKAGEVLMTILDAPMTGWQGIARGLSGVMNGEDVVTAGAEANHMMKGGSEEGFSRLGDKVEGLLSPIDKRFPYLNAGKSAGDTVGLLASLIAPF
jgi:hypothetical protein